jgi:hypothetical protein
MYIVLYAFAAAAVIGAVALSYQGLGQGLGEGAALGLEALEAGVRDHGLLLVGGLILAGLGRVLQHMQAIDAGLRRVANAAEEATRAEA